MKSGVLFVHLWLLLPLVSATTSSQCASQNPSVYHFKFGDIIGHVISDGAVILDQNPWFVRDEAVKRSFSYYHLPTFPFEFPLNVLILDTPTNGRIMLDTGSLAYTNFPFLKDAGLLLKNMKAIGITPQSIDHIIITHAHGDHFGGLTDSQGNRTFPNAKVYIARGEHLFASSNKTFNKPAPFPSELLNLSIRQYKKSIKPYLNDLVLVKENGSPLPGIKFISTPGHTENHQSIQITSKGEKLLFTGDAVLSRASQIQNPEWAFSAETNQTNAYKSRIGILDMAVRERSLVLLYHNVFPGLGYITNNGPWFDWIDAPPQRLGTGVVLRC